MGLREILVVNPNLVTWKIREGERGKVKRRELSDLSTQHFTGTIREF